MLFKKECNKHSKQVIRYTCTLIFSSAIIFSTGCVRYEANPIDTKAVKATWENLDSLAVTEAINLAIEEEGVPKQEYNLVDGISLAEAETTALFFNPLIQETRLVLGCCKAEAKYAGLWKDPTLKIDASSVLANVDNPWGLGLGLSITIPLSGRPAIEVKLAEAGLTDGEAKVIGAEWALVSTVKQEWSKLAILDARIILLKSAISDLQKLIDLAPSFKATGSFTVVDERLLLIEKRQAEDVLQQAMVSREENKLLILELMGLPPNNEWKLSASIPKMKTINQDEIDILKHPSMKLAMASYMVSEAELQLEIRKQYPDLSLGLLGGSYDGNPKVKLGLGLPIAMFNGNKKGIAAADIDRTVVGNEITIIMQELVYRLAHGKKRYNASKSRVDFLTEKIAPLVDEQIKDTRRLAALGQLNFFLLTDTMKQSREIRLNILDAKKEMIKAYLKLISLQGPEIKIKKEIIK